MTAEPADAGFEELLEFIKRERAFDFTGYKRPSLRRRVLRRMQTVGIDDFVAYRNYVAENPEEFAQLFDTILINVTSFFRDPNAWEYVTEEIVPRIVEERDPDEPIRVWSTGCATGEEAYTAAMILAEALGEDRFRSRVKIYATDVDEQALNVGRHAIYTAKAVAAVPEPLRERYFEPIDSRFAFRKDLRRAVVFGRHDLVQDPPISRIDLLISRNTLIYFAAEAQFRILANFRFALAPDGYLFLGRSEVLVLRTNLFTPVDLKRRVFTKLPSAPMLERPGARPDADLRPEERPAERIAQPALETLPVAMLAIGADGTLAFANQQARRLFGVPVADVGRPFKDLELSYRPVELRSRIDEVRAERRALVMRGVEITAAGGDVRTVDVHVVPLAPLGAVSSGIAISFIDTTRVKQLQEEVERSQREMETAYEELQSATEELETTNEELQSTNEELETTNEELQSTNEELETTNEELHSTNEELETLNEELRERTDEANRINIFLQSVLGGMQAGVVVLDRDLRIDVWNKEAEELWGLRADEVAGEQFASLDIGLPVEELRDQLRAALAGEDVPEIQLEAVNRRGRRIACRVTTTPLNGRNGEPLGVILGFEAHALNEA
jgi:two-component system CheB/CheR fusion protein